MDLKKAIKVGCAVKGTNIMNLEKDYGFNAGQLHHITNNNRTKNGPRLDTLERIAAALDMKLSDFIALGE